MAIPSRGATDASIFHPLMLNIKTPSNILKESQAANYTLMRLKGDDLVNHILDSKVERESKKKKQSTTVEVDQLFQNLVAKGDIVKPGENSSKIEKNKRINKAKQSMKESVREETLIMWKTKIEPLVFQGDFIK